MKRVVFNISLIFLIACNSADAPDCLKNTGSIISKNIELEPFNSLLINNEFNVILKEGSQQGVILSVGENLVKDIVFDLKGPLLEISNEISCKWTRDYNFPTIEITHPELTSIEIIGGSILQSEGTLSYPNLTFTSKDSNGNISVNVNSPSLSIDSNEITNYTVSGAVNHLNLIYSSGNGRFEGADLQVSEANIKHSGSNDIIVNISESLIGSINSTGDLIFVNQRPMVIDVEINNRGRLIDGTN